MATSIFMFISLDNQGRRICWSTRTVLMARKGTEQDVVVIYDHDQESYLPDVRLSLEPFEDANWSIGAGSWCSMDQVNTGLRFMWKLEGSGDPASVLQT